MVQLWMLANFHTIDKNKKMNIKFILSTEAQNHFGRLLDDVSSGHTRYIVKRFGTPKAAIIPLKDLETLLSSEEQGEEYLHILRESRSDYSLGEAIQIEAVFKEEKT